MAAPLNRNHPLHHEVAHRDDEQVIGSCQSCGLDIYEADIVDDWAALVPGVGYLCDSCRPEL